MFVGNFIFFSHLESLAKVSPYEYTFTSCYNSWNLTSNPLAAQKKVLLKSVGVGVELVMKALDILIEISCKLETILPSV